jgi:predicted NBD/HSP70 family sugar kinase
VSGQAFRADLQTNGTSIPGLDDLNDVSVPDRVFKLAAQGDSVSQQLVEHVIPYMAYAFASLIRLTNIDRVILLGAFTEGGDYLRDLLYAGISQHLPEVERPRLSIRMGNKLTTNDLVAAAGLPAIRSYLGFQTLVTS